MVNMGNIELKGARNARDLGGIVVAGGVVRSGLLLRGGSLNRLRPRDVEELCDRRGLALVVDLRTESERAEKPDVALPGVECLHIPVFDEAAVGITHEERADAASMPAERIPDLRDLYRRMVSDACLPNLSRIVGMLADAAAGGHPALFHCTEGKDRTGLVAAILLGMLGAGRSAIMADYLLTNEVNGRKAARYYWLARLLKRDPVLAEKLRAVFTAREEYLLSAFGAVDEQWGGLDAFVADGLGIGAPRLQAFRAAVVEPASPLRRL